MKKLKKFLATAFVASTLTACVSTETINQEAASSYAQVKQQAAAKRAIDTTSETAKRIHTVFNKMKPYAEKENKTGVPFNWEIIVLKSHELNAWAMPGGKMAFYTGLVDKLNLSNDEIAVVMGHEMAHALQEHGKADRTVNAVTGVAATLGSIGLQVAGIQTSHNGVDWVEAIADVGITKPFSRKQETEADEVGLMLMARSGYNPSAAPGLWKKMSQVTGGGSSIFSTHPSNEARQANLAKLVPEAMKIYQASK